jgi:hypothetical protein
MIESIEIEQETVSVTKEKDPEAWKRRMNEACARTLLAIERMGPGALVLYHEGHLAFDSEKNPDLAGVAAAYRTAAYDLGRGTLVQKRLDHERCQYFFRRMLRHS